MKKEQWHMNRLGLVDFWYYVNEEFPFKNGHMLLRGSNGSGKSVTMQSFIPLLLDGNKSSERLDSFGTKSRKIENYLLEEDSDRDDRIGYLYLEFKKEEVEMYKTIGMGLHARRNKPLDAWYFVIEDNRRINHDLFLMENHLAITKAVLKNRIGSQYIDSQKEYMERVNQALFGFPNRDEYREAINLLMQVRSPKLSNSLKPTMINEILSDSLQPLSEEDLRPMSEAIASMDELEDQLNALNQSCDAAKAISSIYNQYNYVQLENKLNAYIKTKNEKETLKKEIKKIEKVIAEDETAYQKGIEKLKQLSNEFQTLTEESNTLKEKDFAGLLNELQRLEKDIQEAKRQKEEKEDQKNNKNDAYLNSKESMKKYEDQQGGDYLDMLNLYKDLNQINDNIQFAEHAILEKEVIKYPEKEYDYSYTKTCICKELEQLETGLEYFRKQEHYIVVRDDYIDQKEEQLQNQENEEKNHEKLIKHLSEEIDNQQELFYQWNANNKVLIIDEKGMQRIGDDLRKIEFEDSYHSIEEMILNQYRIIYNRLKVDQNNHQNQYNLIQAELEEADSEYDKWLNMKDSLPDIDDYARVNREYLVQNNIPFKSLYEILEFETNVEESEQNQIEEILMRAGLLHVLVIEEKYKDLVLKHRDGMADSYLFIKKELAALSSYWISNPVQDFDLKELFFAIGADEPSFEISHLVYKMGDVYGTISSEYQSHFIGKIAREKYRQKKLDEYLAQITSLNHKSDILMEKMNEINTHLEILDNEYHGYPKKDKLESLKKEIIQSENELNAIVSRVQNLDKTIGKYQNDISMLQQSISNLANHLGINALRNVFEERKESFKDYQNVLLDLINRHQHYIKAHELYLSYQGQAEAAENDLFKLRDELSRLVLLIQRNNQLIQSLQSQLKESGYEDVVSRLKEIDSRLIQIKKLETDENMLQGTRTEKINANKEKLSEHYINISEQEQKERKAYERYKQEAALKYVLSEDISADQFEEVYAYLEKGINVVKKKDLSNDLQNIFYSNRGNLQEYNLGIVNLFEDDEEASRLDIHARYQGVKVSFPVLVEKLNESIILQNNLLEESDRHLIEDILINTISKKIKHHIQKSDLWVKNMNRYMNEMNTSSGFKLGLQWKSHKAENDDELNSEKLVELLSKDVSILKDSDYKSLSAHFRSKIATARRLSQQEDTNESLHVIMRRVLDYRNWFDFTILYEKTGEKKKEMTNNKFYSFSGGEKAMAMYVPLFSAVAAKFENTREDAPVLIALDEAFAGMDDKNISNMFDLISKFKFDYIMNSQVLWGDYPTVKGLAIHELFRPENAKYVTVISYEWNGYQKRLVHQ